MSQSEIWYWLILWCVHLTVCHRAEWQRASSVKSMVSLGDLEATNTNLQKRISRNDSDFQTRCQIHIEICEKWVFVTCSINAWMQRMTRRLRLPGRHAASGRRGQYAILIALIHRFINRFEGQFYLLYVDNVLFIHQTYFYPSLDMDVHRYKREAYPSIHPAIFSAPIFLYGVIWGWSLSQHALGEIRRIQWKLE